jgi:hypothetical protein
LRTSIIDTIMPALPAAASNSIAVVLIQIVAQQPGDQANLLCSISTWCALCFSPSSRGFLGLERLLPAPTASLGGLRTTPDERKARGNEENPAARSHQDARRAGTTCEEPAAGCRSCSAMALSTTPWPRLDRRSGHRRLSGARSCSRFVRCCGGILAAA